MKTYLIYDQRHLHYVRAEDERDARNVWLAEYNKGEEQPFEPFRRVTELPAESDARLSSKIDWS